MDVPTGPESKFQLKELKGTVAYSDLAVELFWFITASYRCDGFRYF